MYLFKESQATTKGTQLYSDVEEKRHFLRRRNSRNREMRYGLRDVASDISW